MSRLNSRERRAGWPAPSESKGYNGWTNYETWCVHLWISNDEMTYEACREIADRRGADGLKDEVEGWKQDESGLFADLLTSSLSRVDWEEIARALVKDE